MTYRDLALTDAAMTVQLWRREPLPARRDMRLHIARELHCTPSWPVIQNAIVRRLIAMHE